MSPTLIGVDGLKTDCDGHILHKWIGWLSTACSLRLPKCTFWRLRGDSGAPLSWVVASQNWCFVDLTDLVILASPRRRELISLSVTFPHSKTAAVDCPRQQSWIIGGWCGRDKPSRGNICSLVINKLTLSVWLMRVCVCILEFFPQ